jgi:hypothetical protein
MFDTRDLLGAMLGSGMGGRNPRMAGFGGRSGGMLGGGGLGGGLGGMLGRGGRRGQRSGAGQEQRQAQERDFAGHASFPTLPGTEPEGHRRGSGPSSRRVGCRSRGWGRRYVRCRARCLFISNMVTRFLPNTGSSLASARISRRSLGSCRLCSLM